ncbi:hypothetical protein CRE_15208 [Caenorhabditis remanei]|uniref:Domain of unknown function DB domain-containing protein n=1 Tax=Caenorhabditis remanei TaxID=31234 RepID=E3NRY0_CAERE|nr:hypothetical protein CRE_15208 [Caenorhabditis remanei]
MREKHLLQPLLLFLLSTTVSTQLSCHRIPTSFCCTTRIRDQCPEQCATVQCGTEFIHNFSITSFEKPDQPAPPTKVDETWTPDSNSNLNLNPDSNSGDARVGGASRSSFETTTLPTTSSGFPFFSQTPPPPPAPSVISNSGDVFARSRKEISATPDFEQQSGTVATLSFFWRIIEINCVPRDSSVPSSLPSSFNHLRRFSSRSSSPSFAHSRDHHRLICRLTTPGRLLCNRPMPRLHRSRYVTPPKYWKTSEVRMKNPSGMRIRKKNFATTRIHITPFMGELARKRRKLDSGSSHEWKMSIIPRGQNNKATGVNSIPPFTIDGKADERFNKFYRTIDSVMNKLYLINSGDHSGREKEPQIRLEIRAAMDRGQCGIFNVAPFLECASQGKDNSECCRHRGIVQKTSSISFQCPFESWNQVHSDIVPNENLHMEWIQNNISRRDNILESQIRLLSSFVYLDHISITTNSQRSYG